MTLQRRFPELAVARCELEADRSASPLLITNLSGVLIYVTGLDRVVIDCTVDPNVGRPVTDLETAWTR